MPYVAHTPTDPNVLTNGAYCYRVCIPKGLQAAVIIWLLDQWNKKKEPEPPPVVPFVVWSPATVVLDWTDGSGNHVTDYPTFLSTVDLSTFSSVNTHDPDLYKLDTFQANYVTSLLSVDFEESVNTFASIDVTGCTGLQSFTVIATATPFTVTGITDCISLVTFILQYSPLVAIDVHGLTLLQTLDVSNNQLGTLNITGDFAITTLNFSANPAVVIIGP